MSRSQTINAFKSLLDDHRECHEVTHIRLAPPENRLEKSVLISMFFYKHPTNNGIEESQANNRKSSTDTLVSKYSFP